MYQYVKDRASRTQSESSLSNFAEAKSILEVKLQRSRNPIRSDCECKSRYRFSDWRIFLQSVFNRRSKTLKTPLYKGEKNVKKKCPIEQMATIGHSNRKSGRVLCFHVITNPFKIRLGLTIAHIIGMGFSRKIITHIHLLSDGLII